MSFPVAVCCQHYNSNHFTSSSFYGIVPLSKP